MYSNILKFENTFSFEDNDSLRVRGEECDI